MGGQTGYYTDVLGLDAGDLRYVDCDFVSLDLGERKYQAAYGDPLIPLPAPDGGFRYKIAGGSFHGAVGSTTKDVPLRTTPILKFSMIDVQQGDGMLLETPQGDLITIDAGDNQLFARHLAARFAGSSQSKPIEIDAMIVTHGDADHFAGLTEIRDSEKETAPDRLRKRLFIHPKRVFHNGLVKMPTKVGGVSVAEKDRFGKTAVDAAGALHVTALEDNLLNVPDNRMNAQFKAWRDCLTHWNDRRRTLGLPAIRFARIDHRSTEFGELESADLKFELFGPIAVDIGGKPALEFLKAPKKDPVLHLSEEPAVTGSLSASHTVNGHSISFRLVYKNVRILFTGDLNQQAMARIDEARPAFDFTAEVLKAPHHGSHDFDMGLLKKVKPVVSMISSGDENAFHEHIHPRATLVSALGRVSRGDSGVIFMTELAAFFTHRGLVAPVGGSGSSFHGFERTNFGIIHIRTDGERLLAFTHSGEAGVNEAYAFGISNTGKVTEKPIKSVK